MNLIQSFKMAVSQIKANKLRSSLTMLGIIIGTMSVVLFVTIVSGSREAMYDEYRSAGSDTITTYITPKNSNNKLSYDDSLKLKDVDGIINIAPLINGEVKVKYDSKEENIGVIGTNNNYKELNKLKINKGRFILPIDVENSNKVVVLGEYISEKLFDLQDPIGKNIDINGIPYKVVGVLKQVYSYGESPEDKSIYIPIINAERLLKANGVSSVYMSADINKPIDKIISSIESVLLRFLNSKEDFNISSAQQLIESMKSMDVIMDIMVGAIAGVALFVAGIGIMNMMLVSVSERTKEIGIRKALGAKRKSILVQFLIEAIIISVLGGVIGILIGIAGSLAVLNIIGTKLYIDWGVILVAISFSILTGVIFGILPANKASKLQPIQALRAN